MAYTPDVLNAVSDNPNRWAGEVFRALTSNLTAAKLTSLLAALEAEGLPTLVAEYADLNLPDHTRTIGQALTVVMQELGLSGYSQKDDMTNAEVISVNLDETKGYAIGSHVKSVGDIFFCESATAGAAVWVLIS